MKIGLLGYGTVGKGVEELINQSKDDISVKTILMISKEYITQDNMTVDYEDILNDPEIDAIVECMGGLHPAYEYCLAALKKGKHVISSNKKMIATYYRQLLTAANENNVVLRFSSACGGGIPWLSNLSLISNNDHILNFHGIMNGTSNYILDRIFAYQLSFEEALKQAQQKGYAEADPSDDIDGYDTAYKTVLSANVAFKGCFDPSQLLIKGIRTLSQTEINFCQSKHYHLALTGNGVLKDHRIGLAVFPQFIKEGDSLYGISSNNNCFVVESEHLGELSFKGQGAGRYPTASNVLSDIKAIMAGIPFNHEIENDTKADDQLITGQFYIRTTEDSIFHDVIWENYDQYIITREISVAQLRNYLKQCHDDKMFIARMG